VHFLLSLSDTCRQSLSLLAKSSLKKISKHGMKSTDLTDLKYDGKIGGLSMLSAWLWQWMSRCWLSVLLCAVCLAAPANVLLAQGRKFETAGHVKVTAMASKPDGSGQQSISIVLDIEKDFYIFANPVGNEDLQPSATSVRLTVEGKPVAAKVSFPPGKIVKNKLIGDYQIYQGTITIQAVVIRPLGSNIPLEAMVGMRGVPLSGAY
jgi:hypothetical protein